MSAWIITIGDELLSGRVINWNAYWMAKRLTSIGIKVKRIICIPDDHEEIINTILQAIRDKATYIFTTGGLGPTPGDITLEAIAQAVNRPLELNETAKEYVKRRYEELYELGVVASPELNESRLKMAKVPRGAEVVYNDIGVAPGVILHLSSKECLEIVGEYIENPCQIISLPGVPSEALYLFEKIVVRLKGQKTWVIEDYIDVSDESIIAKILNDVRKSMPEVSIKTYPIGFGQNQMKIIAIASNEELAKKAIQQFKAKVKELLES